MRKIIEETVHILKELAVGVSNGKVSQADCIVRIVRLSEALQKWSEEGQRLNDEKLDFLIFMQSKTTKILGHEAVITGETMFTQWLRSREKFMDAHSKAADEAAKNDSKPIPNETDQSFEGGGSTP